MTTVEIIAAIDRDKPQQIRVTWALYQASLHYDDVSFEYQRSMMSDISHHLIARGYTIVEEDIDPRGGIEGWRVYWKA